MKKKRTINIEREYLRKILKKAAYDKIGKLREETSQYEVGDERRLLLIRQKDALWSAVDKSICKCPSCGTETSDMTFTPYLKAWVCTKCYAENQAFYKKHGESHLFP